MPSTAAATFDTFDALQLVPSAANATVAAKPPRNVHEHAAALGAPLLRSGWHAWEVRVDAPSGGLNVCVGVAAADADVSRPPLLPVRTGFAGWGVRAERAEADDLPLARYAQLAPGEEDAADELDGCPPDAEVAALPDGAAAGDGVDPNSGAPRPGLRGVAADATDDAAASDARRGAAWGYSPYERAVYVTADARRWGRHARALVDGAAPPPPAAAASAAAKDGELIVNQSDYKHLESTAGAHAAQ